MSACWTRPQARRLRPWQSEIRRQPRGSLLRAVRLRESLHGIFTAAIAGAAPPPSTWANLNSRLWPKPWPQLAFCPTATGFSLGLADLSSSLDHVLWPVVRSAAEPLRLTPLERKEFEFSDLDDWMREADQLIRRSQAVLDRLAQARRRATV